MVSRSHYEVLGLSTTASQKDIRQAYRRLALKWHPDKQPGNPLRANQKFKEIKAAYEALINSPSEFNCGDSARTATTTKCDSSYSWGSASYNYGSKTYTYYHWSDTTWPRQRANATDSGTQTTDKEPSNGTAHNFQEETGQTSAKTTEENSFWNSWVNEPIDEIFEKFRATLIQRLVFAKDVFQNSNYWAYLPTKIELPDSLRNVTTTCLSSVKNLSIPNPSTFWAYWLRLKTSSQLALHALTVTTLNWLKKVPIPDRTALASILWYFWSPLYTFGRSMAMNFRIGIGTLLGWSSTASWTTISTLIKPFDLLTASGAALIHMITNWLSPSPPDSFQFQDHPQTDESSDEGDNKDESAPFRRGVRYSITVRDGEQVVKGFQNGNLVSESRWKL